MAGIPKVKRSGGPRSVEGKSAASKNSLKTGAYSSLVVLPNESQDDFLKLQSQFAESLFPVGVAKTALVHDLTVITWKKLRLEKLEQSAFVRTLNSRVRYYDLDSGLGLDSQYEWLINRIEMVSEDFIAEATLQIGFINTLGDSGISKDQLFDLPRKMPALFEIIQDLALEHFETDIRDPKPENMTGLFVYDEDNKRIPFLDYALEFALKRARQVIYVSEHLDAIKSAVNTVKEKRLLDQVQVVGLTRANDELSRAYFKTLGELRKQQQWRLKMSAIDVESTQIPE
jgi:hypothetical protein